MRRNIQSLLRDRLLLSTDDLRTPVLGPLRRATYRTAALIWAAALLIGSLQPMRPAHFHFSIAHHVAHFVGFGALAFLATVGFSKASRTAFLPATEALLLGCLIEFLQHLQNRMPIEWYDVRDDALGVIACAALCYMVYRRPGGFQNASLRANDLFLSERE